ncbi:MAG: terminase TerL endonuclease subunit [Bacillota bacterium]
MDRIREAYNKAKETPALQNAFRRLRLNQWVQQEIRWLDLAAWDATAGIVTPEELKGRHCYGGLDLASTTDIAALALVFPGDNNVIDVLMYFWIPEENMQVKERKDRVPYSTWVRQGLVTPTPGNVIDYGAIRKKINDLGAIYNIREVGHDPWNATQLALDLQGDGFTMVPVRQGFASLSPPTKELLNFVLSKRLRHGGNPVLRWMADSMVVKTDAAGNLKPDKSKSTARIDGMVALIMAIDRATRNEKVLKPGVIFLKGAMPMKPVRMPKIRLPSLKINNEVIQELAMLAGFLMVMKGLWMVYPPAMWIIGGLWLAFPGKKVR